MQCWTHHHHHLLHPRPRPHAHHCLPILLLGALVSFLVLGALILHLPSPHPAPSRQGAAPLAVVALPRVVCTASFVAPILALSPPPLPPPPPHLIHQWSACAVQQSGCEACHQTVGVPFLTLPLLLPSSLPHHHRHHHHRTTITPLAYSHQKLRRGWPLCLKKRWGDNWCQM